MHLNTTHFLANMENKEDQLLLASPFGRVYHRQEMGMIMNCAIGLTNPVDVDSIKSAFSNSIMVTHPRFSSLMTKDSSGRTHWEKLPYINLDEHIIIIRRRDLSPNIMPTAQEKEDAVNAYLAEIAVSSPLSKEKPLWELHVLIGMDCLVLRVHHSIGDGTSLMSMLSACFGRNSNDMNHVAGRVGSNERWQRERGARDWIKSLWYTMVFSGKLHWKMMVARDEKTVISGGRGVELWPRKLVTLKFKLQDIKAIKKAVPHVTVNDVFLGMISSGLSKYLQSTKDQQDKLQVTGICAVNMRNVSALQASELTNSNFRTGWGNKNGSFLVPFSFHSKDGRHPLQHVKAIKSLMDRKKQSFEAHMSYSSVRNITTLFGSKVGTWFYKRCLLRTTFFTSNIVGPRETIVIAGNPVNFIRVVPSSSPQAMSLFMVSYAERVDLQILMAKDIIHKPDFLARCFEESFNEMVYATA
ncbi:hypothetical protein Droror1_Dr00013268 [Drosera rotundifolia]